MINLAPYPLLNNTIAGTDVMQLFVYANSITYGLFMPFVALAFYIIVLIGSFVAQQRFTAVIRPEVSFLAAAFATLGFVIIMAQRTGLIEPWVIMLTIGLTIFSLIWVAMSSD